MGLVADPENPTVLVLHCISPKWPSLPQHRKHARHKDDVVNFFFCTSINGLKLKRHENAPHTSINLARYATTILLLWQVLWILNPNAHLQMHGKYTQNHVASQDWKRGFLGKNRTVNTRARDWNQVVEMHCQTLWKPRSYSHCNGAQRERKAGVSQGRHDNMS